MGPLRANRIGPEVEVVQAGVETIPESTTKLCVRTALGDGRLTDPKMQDALDRVVADLIRTTAARKAA